MPLADYSETESVRALVVLVNNVRDWEIACTQGWYRIPVSRAPRQIGADVLAFYFTRAFPELAWAVRYAAPVLGYYLASRRELLPEEPDHPRAEDMYHRVEIGAVEPLPHPIPSRRLRRITFIPTTLDRLLSAEEINDLWVREPPEGRLWRVLKGAGLHPEERLEIREGGVEYSVPIAILCARGGVGVGLAERAAVPDGWAYVHAPSDDAEAWARTLARVLVEVERRGGPRLQGTGL